MKHLPTSRRPGFTLIEILIVIAIIVILVSLLLSGVYYAYAAMKRTGAASDINQLNASLQAFKAKYGVYPPSRIRLCSSYTTYTTSPTPAANGGAALDQASITFINRMWPNIGQWSGVDWAGIGQPVEAAFPQPAQQILEGDQCLVFFLGGIPSNPNVPGGFSFNGFSVNPKDPASLNANSNRVAPFFAFDTSRMLTTLRPNSVLFPSFNDYYSQPKPVPYLYFSANNVRNGYTLGYGITLKDNSGNPPGSNAPVTVSAYFQSVGNSVQWQNPDTCQIICAGSDGAFGLVGVPGQPGALAWTPATAEGVFPSSPRNSGVDDQTNFYSAMMGVSQ